eukprot:5431582-Pleurochrysis_carterae.AAC.3
MAGHSVGRTLSPSSATTSPTVKNSALSAAAAASAMSSGSARCPSASTKTVCRGGKRASEFAISSSDTWHCRASASYESQTVSGCRIVLEASADAEAGNGTDRAAGCAMSIATSSSAVSSDASKPRVSGARVALRVGAQPLCDARHLVLDGGQVGEDGRRHGHAEPVVVGKVGQAGGAGEA